MSTKSCVFPAELPTELRLFVKTDEQVKGQPHDCCVSEEAHVAQNERLPQHETKNSDVHRVAHIAIKTGDDQMLRRKRRRGRTRALQCKSREGIDQYRETSGDEQDSQYTDGHNPEKWRLHTPARNPPGRQPRYRSGSHHQEQRGSKDGRKALHGTPSHSCGQAGQTGTLAGQDAGMEAISGKESPATALHPVLAPHPMPAERFQPYARETPHTVRCETSVVSGRGLEFGFPAEAIKHAGEFSGDVDGFTMLDIATVEHMHELAVAQQGD